MTRFLVYSWFVLCIASVHAGDFPEFPELGAALGQLDTSLYRCDVSGSEDRCMRPGGADDRVAGDQIIEVVLFFREGMLSRAVMVFDEQRFDQVESGLIAILGAGEQASESLKAGMGGVFDNRLRIWRQRGRVYMLEQFFERIINSGLMVTDESGYQRLVAEREASRVRGARDL